jgi:hypothetical protein
MLSQAHRRSIHTSLAPTLGEEETDALMSEFPASESDMPVTVTHFDATVNGLRSEMHLGFAQVDTKIEVGIANLETKIEETMKDAFRMMVIVIASAVVGGMGLSAVIAAGIAQVLNGGSP